MRSSKSNDKLLFVITILLMFPANIIAQQIQTRQLQNRSLDTSQVNLYLKLGQHHVSKPGENSIDLDSGITFLQNAKQLSQKLQYTKGLGQSYVKLSQAFREKGDKERGMLYIEQAIALYKKNNSHIELGDALMEKRNFYSIYNSNNEEVLERIQVVEQALKAYKKNENIFKQAECLKELGDLYAVIENYGIAIEKLKKSLKLYESIEYESVQGLYDLLGVVYTFLGDPKEGLKYGLLAIKTAEMVQDTSIQLCTIYNRVGMTYFDLNDLERSNLYFQNAIEIAQKYNDLQSIVFIETNIVNTLISLNRASEALTFHQDITRRFPAKEIYQNLKYIENFVTIYQGLQQYDKAQSYCNQVLKLVKKIENNFSYPRLTYNIVLRFFLASKQYHMVRKYLPAHLENAKKSSEPRFLSAAHNLWFELDSAQGNYQSALLHYQQSKSWLDTLINEKKNKQIAQLQIQFETEKKDQNIELLIKNGLLQQAELEKANFIRNVTFGGIALLIIIVALIYNQYQTKQHNNQILHKLIAEKDSLLNEKEWLLREIHHRVKNNLQIVMSLLNTQSAFLESDAAIFAIRESQHRMQAMSLIHEKLYQSENVATIDMPTYVKDLINYFRDSYNIDNYIRFEICIDPIKLDVTQAVPLGLILNEATTNAIKYAFPEKQNGSITIQMHYLDNNVLQLKVQDSGIGISENFEPQKSGSLGMNLMQGLAKQLYGTFSIENNKGLIITVTFKDEKMKSTDSHLSRSSKTYKAFY